MAMKMAIAEVTTRTTAPITVSGSRVMLSTSRLAVVSLGDTGCHASVGGRKDESIDGLTAPVSRSTINEWN